MTTETTVTEDVEGPSSDAPGYHLLVMSPKVFFSQPLPASGVVTIGRSSKCELRLEDPMASREHARIVVEAAGDRPRLIIEDAGSANGTRVKEVALHAGERTAILPGDATIIGSTVIMVLENRGPAGARRLWSHDYFEARVEDECARAAKSRSAFALARVRFSGPAPWTKVLSILARDLTAPHVFASYGPKDYEILLVDTKPEEAEALVEGLVASCRAAQMDARWAIAWYPKNGRTCDALLASANALLRVRSGATESDAGAGTEAASMQRVREMATRAASSPINVLILGETGVGKDVLAQLIHRLSPRGSKPFVALNCAGLSETLIESELFGHEKGAFTGATTAKLGLFESANGGTVFLDEIGEMPASLQAKLLRVIETREVRLVGGVRARPIDVRFISATNKDLEAAVVRGEFRGDLMFRLNGISLSIPPLRERMQEIPALVETFIAEACQGLGREPPPKLSQEAMDGLLAHRWPGNIRELRNVVDRALVLCDGDEIRPEHLPIESMRSAPALYVSIPIPEPARATPSGGHAIPDLSDPIKSADRQRIMDALVACAYNQTRAAQLLGMPRRTFVSKLDAYGIPRPQKAPA